MMNTTAHFADRSIEELTLLDYHAARAPKEIPAWFMPTPEPYEGPALPEIPSDITLEENEILTQWLRGHDGWDLPPKFQWFAVAHLVHEEAVRVHRAEHERWRYFQWPWGYANGLLIHRETYLDEENKTIRDNDPESVPN